MDVTKSLERSQTKTLRANCWFALSLDSFWLFQKCSWHYFCFSQHIFMNTFERILIRRSAVYYMCKKHFQKIKGMYKSKVLDFCPVCFSGSDNFRSIYFNLPYFIFEKIQNYRSSCFNRYWIKRLKIFVTLQKTRNNILPILLNHAVHLVEQRTPTHTTMF